MLSYVRNDVYIGLPNRSISSNRLKILFLKFQVHSNGKTSPVGYDDTEDSNSSSTCSTNVTDANQSVQVTNTGIPSGATVQSSNSLTTLGIPGPPPSTSNLPDWYSAPTAMPPPAPSIDYHHHHHPLNHHLNHHHLMHNHHHGAATAY